ncbi:MAG: hypothetical protein WBA31_05265 [Candidatus Dormiibacterota bacterium]
MAPIRASGRRTQTLTAQQTRPVSDPAVDGDLLHSRQQSADIGIKLAGPGQQLGPSYQ